MNKGSSWLPRGIIGTRFCSSRYTASRGIEPLLPALALKRKCNFLFAHSLGNKAILLLQKIPRGKVVTYKEMARVCGTSPRAIGRIMAANQNPREYPCYKVIASSGALTGYSGHGGLKEKERLLAADGIPTAQGRVDKKYFHQFNQFNKRSAR